MQIHLSITFRGKTSEFKVEATSIVIGRSHGGGPVDIDLPDDTRASRRHAWITWEKESFWLEDLGSRHGTKLNGIEIKNAGKQAFKPLDVALVGETRLRLEPNITQSVTQVPAEPKEVIVADVAGARKRGFESVEAESVSLQRLVAILSELPARWAAEIKLERLCQATVETVAELIPGAQKCALLLKDRADNHLSLQAFLPKNEQRPDVSEHLANRAISAMRGFIWPDTEDEHIAQYHPLGSGMYSPLVWNHEAIGVICVDNASRRTPFTSFDLHLTTLLSQYAGMAIAQHAAREALTKQTEFTNRLFSSRFPPAVRDGLMRQAADDSLPTGTRRSLVTVLNSDIRQFTKLSEELGPRRIGDLLNEYFPPLIDAIFAFGGTVERFAGDGIFAVFGAPDFDDKQQEHAVRAAMEMQRTVSELNEVRGRRKGPASKIGLGIGIGIDCGELLNGFIGNAERLEFAVVGDAANYASRYCSSAQPGEILIGQNVHSRVWKLVDSERREIIDKHEVTLTAYVIRGLSKLA
jgi:adenylate cyclase